jgi:hypothetical protein
MAITMTTTMIASTRPTRASSFWSGVVSVGASCSIPAIRPISVCMPVATTTARPWPYVAAVPLVLDECVDCTGQGCHHGMRGDTVETLARATTLPSSLSQSTELPTAAHRSQSPALRLTVEKAFWRNGT